MTTNDNDNVIVEVDETYTFTISEKTIPDYRMNSGILAWIKENMENLVDDDNHAIFGKVNTGFNESTLKSFGKKPVCDVYINNVEYTNDFDNNYPLAVNTIILFHLKGSNNITYDKACQLHDYVMQEFIENESFKSLNGVVRNTCITNSEIRNQPINKKWGVIVAFELKHDLY